MKNMKIVLSVAIALGVLAPVAQAKPRTTTPPGNSSVQQYLETFPTASGSRPTNTVPRSGPHRGGPGGGGTVGGGTAGGGTAGGGTTGGGTGSSISRSTQRKLAAQGATGLAAASLALATAPPVAQHGTSSGPSGSTGAGNAGQASRGNGGAAPATSLADALTGTGNSGLGSFLPLILVVALVGSALIAITRRHRSSG
jgi:hypothetical protein